jgi:hypothetical protein
VGMCGLAYPACNMYVTTCGPFMLYQIFQHLLTNNKIFEKRVFIVKLVFLFSQQLSSKTFLILRRIYGDIVINVKMSSCKVLVILVGFSWVLNVRGRYSKMSRL